VSEHYPESAIGAEVEADCRRCGRYTKRRIIRHTQHAGRLGPCLECTVQQLTKAQKKHRDKEQHEKANPRLFT